MTRTALIAGASGLVGGHCLPLLLDRYDHVVSLARRAVLHEESRLETLETDFRDLAALQAKLAVDDVFCCLGTTLRRAGSKVAFEAVDYHMVVDLARATRAAGAKRFLVVSAAGASARSPAFYGRVKARMEGAVAELGFEAVHILRPSLLLGARKERRPGERLAQRAAPLLGPLLRGRLAKYRPIDAREVAETMVRLAFSDLSGVQVHDLPLK